ncbi:MAG: hypothetical protein ACT4ON_14750 [Bacteroidota bacterium]
MKKTTPLFRLIKSLTKSEKIYFKKFASQHVIGDKNNYVKIFDAIDRLDEYEEKKLKNSLKNELVVNYVAEAKFYLHKLILKSLDAFHAASSIDSKIRESLNCIEILFKKQLTDDAYQLLCKTRKLAYDHDRFLFLIELLKWERRVHIEKNDIKKMQKAQLSFLKDSRALMDMEGAIHQTMMHHDAFLIYGFQYTLEEDKHFKEVDNLYQQLLPKLKRMEKTYLPFDAQRFLYNTHRQYYTLKREYKKAYAWSVGFLKVIESKSSKILSNPGMYATALHNHFLCLVMMNKNQEAQVTIKKMKAIPTQYKGNTENIKLLIFNVFHLELSWYHRRMDFRGAVKLIKEEEIELKIKELGKKIAGPSRIVLYDNISWTYFVIGDFRSALKWINYLFNDTELQHVKEHTQCLLRILNLMIHIELGNDEYIDYITKSTYRYLKKRQRLYKSETVFIHFLNKISEVEVPAQRNPLFLELKNQLSLYKNDPVENAILEQLAILTWIDSKLKGITFEEQILKEMKK